MRLQNARPILLPAVLFPTFHVILRIDDIFRRDDTVTIHVFCVPDQQQLLGHVLDDVRRHSARCRHACRVSFCRHMFKFGGDSEDYVQSRKHYWVGSRSVGDCMGTCL
jgi:hypothetical protein